ncbi:PfkB family carbohydrate kinase [Micromonospora sp. NPDC049374]|uniref:PfkB family carbohydrate kinase n=1 Tax=Micromonospora sp. NPDC049374 TaxID=3154352 RepID=UPI003449F311
MSGPLVVLGDTLLDRDIDGTVDRLCPDAPAPVLDERSATDRPGGAGLAALLAAADGHDVVLVTALADDPAAARLTALLTSAGVRLHPIPLPGATPEKIRLRAQGQTLLRLDRGGHIQPCGEPSAATLEVLAAAEAILVSDYGRGVARQPALRQALAATSAPVVWDPHPRGPAAVPGCRLLTPNERELFQLTADAATGPRLSGVARSARTLRDRWRAAAVAVTLGGDGSLLCHNGGAPLVVPAPTATVGDTCGAGDRFASAAARALAQGALVSEAVEEAVRVASAYVAADGPAALTAPTPVADDRATPGVAITGAAGDGGRAAASAMLARVRANQGTLVATGGCFDLLHTGHLATLQAARRLGDCLIVCLNSDRSVADLKGPDRPITPQADRARLLAALDCVDAVVIFDEPTPQAVLSWLRPDIWVKGGDYARGADPDHPDLPEAAQIRGWGGQTVLVPYLHGHSTSSTIAALRADGGHLTEGRR